MQVKRLDSVAEIENKEEKEDFMEILKSVSIIVTGIASIAESIEGIYHTYKED